MIVATITFDNETQFADAQRAILGLDTILKMVHHPAQIAMSTIATAQIIPPLEIIEAEFYEVLAVA